MSYRSTLMHTCSNFDGYMLEHIFNEWIWMCLNLFKLENIDAIKGESMQEKVKPAISHGKSKINILMQNCSLNPYLSISKLIYF